MEVFLHHLANSRRIERHMPTLRCWRELVFLMTQWRLMENTESSQASLQGVEVEYQGLELGLGLKRQVLCSQRGECCFLATC